MDDPYIESRDALVSGLDEAFAIRDEKILPTLRHVLQRYFSTSATADASASIPTGGSCSSSVVVVSAGDAAEVSRLCGELSAACASVQEELATLEEMLVVLRCNANNEVQRIGGPPELLRRQRLVADASAKVMSLLRLLDDLHVATDDLVAGKTAAACALSGFVPPSRETTVRIPIPPAAFDKNGKAVDAADDDGRPDYEGRHIRDNDEFLRHHQSLAEREMNQQDEVLDRLSHGVRRVHESASLISEEVRTQQSVIQDVTAAIVVVHEKVVAANKKVQHLLDNMSNKTKILTIVILMIVLIILIVASM